jgi:uncharacterized protein (DUF58 family)
MKDSIHQGIEGLLIGVLAAATIIYAFQTRVKYPDVVLKTMDHPWLLLLLTIAILFVFKWSGTIAAFLLLLLLAFVMDTMIFARPLPTLLNESPSEQLSHASAANAVHHIPYTLENDGPGLPLASVSLPTPIYPLFHTANDEIRESAAPF